MDSINVVLIEDNIYARDAIVKSINDKYENVFINCPSTLKEVEELIANRVSDVSAIICDMNLSNFETSYDDSLVNNGLDLLLKARNHDSNLPLALYSSSSLSKYSQQDHQIHVIDKISDQSPIDSFTQFLNTIPEFQSTEELIKKIEETPIKNRKQFEHSIIEVKQDIKTVNSGLLKKVALNPSLMKEITWRNFEELIAELLDHLGYSVTLGKGTKDGGKDILAIRKDEFCEFVLAVECKHYTHPRKVGRPTIQQLLGVVEANRYNAGIVATSSFFTSEASTFATPLQPKILLRDFHDIERILKEQNKEINR